MSVCSGREMVRVSTSASRESKRQSSPRVACSENSAKFTPTPSQVAPSGYGAPGQTLMLFLGTVRISPEAATKSAGSSSRIEYHVQLARGNRARRVASRLLSRGADQKKRRRVQRMDNANAISTL